MNNNKPNLRVVDLFAGCGGLTLGFQNAGFDVVAAVDNWEPALRVYRDNFLQHDIHDVDLSNVKESVKFLNEYGPDMIIGGPPCQDFSDAGKRDESLGRADLTVSYAEIIARVKPKYFLMENVERIIKSNALQKAKRIFKGAGYGLTWQVLDASYCGAPQKRKRFIMIGVLGGADDALILYLTKNFSKAPMTVRKYFGESLNLEHYYRHPRNYSRRAIYSVDEPSATIRGVNRPIPAGYPGHPADSTKDLKKVRPLTTHERARIQTFPKRFILRGGKSELEQLIGNAVPVKLAEYVANSLGEYLSTEVVIEKTRKRFALAKRTVPVQQPLAI